MPRLKIDLDERTIGNYAKLGASNREIADMVGCDESVIRRRCGPLLAKSRAERRFILRGYQWQAAKNLNPTILIWLGKNELGQKDEPSKNDGDRAPAVLTIPVLVKRPDGPTAD